MTKVVNELLARLLRARRQGYADEVLYHGDRSRSLPNTFRDGKVYFTRDKEYATGFAKQGGHDAPRAFLLKNKGVYHDKGKIDAASYQRLVDAVAKENPKLAKEFVSDITDKGADWFRGFAKARPDFVVHESPGIFRQALEKGTSSWERTLKNAGFDAVDTGRDVIKLSPDGIRLVTAKFDPRKINSKDITAALAVGAGAAAALHPTASEASEAAQEIGKQPDLAMTAWQAAQMSHPEKTRYQIWKERSPNVAGFINGVADPNTYGAAAASFADPFNLTSSAAGLVSPDFRDDWRTYKDSAGMAPRLAGEIAGAGGVIKAGMKGATSIIDKALRMSGMMAGSDVVDAAAGKEDALGLHTAGKALAGPAFYAPWKVTAGVTGGTLGAAALADWLNKKASANE